MRNSHFDGKNSKNVLVGQKMGMGQVSLTENGHRSSYSHQNSLNSSSSNKNGIESMKRHQKIMTFNADVENIIKGNSGSSD